MMLEIKQNDMVGVSRPFRGEFGIQHDYPIMSLHANLPYPLTDWRVSNVAFDGGMHIVPTSLPTVFPLSEFGPSQEIRITSQFRDLDKLAEVKDFHIQVLF